MIKLQLTPHSIMALISSVVVTVFLNCFLSVSVVHADIESFADQIHSRIWLDIQHYWDDDDEVSIAARRELTNQAETSLVNGLNEMLRGQNLDPGQRYTWSCTGIGSFRLDYPRPNYPEFALRAVHYWKPAGDSGLIVFGVDWSVHWEGLSHAAHNGPYIHFRITGGWATWTRNDDVWVIIDQPDMTMHGTTWYVVEDGAVTVRHFGISPFSILGLGEIDYNISYTNPNRHGSEHRVGNRIITELQNTYSQRIKFLVYSTLLRDFVSWRLGGGENIASNSDGFWSRQADWARAEEDTYGSFLIR